VLYRYGTVQLTIHSAVPVWHSTANYTQCCTIMAQYSYLHTVLYQYGTVQLSTHSVVPLWHSTANYTQCCTSMAQYSYLHTVLYQYGTVQVLKKRSTNDILVGCPKCKLQKHNTQQQDKLSIHKMLFWTATATATWISFVHLWNVKPADGCIVQLKYAAFWITTVQCCVCTDVS